MPGYARKEIVREGEIGVYHTWSRCVQKAFLCGLDPETGIDFDYRRVWIKSLLEYLARVFAVDVGNYSVLSNHQHLIVRTRPDIADQWSAEEVAWRWKLAWPTWIAGQWVREPTDEEIHEVLARPERIPKLRANLASLSWFMARWKEPIARLANAEWDRKGHFYEQRFGSREIVDDPANLCCNVYVDLNQIKAQMADSLEDSHCSAIQDRLQAWRNDEAQASVEAFHAEGQVEFSLEVGEVERLLADCFLAPIGDQEPPLPDRAPIRLTVPDSPRIATKSESESPAESFRDELANSLPDDALAADSLSAEPAAEPRVEPVVDASDSAAVSAASFSVTPASAPAQASAAESRSSVRSRGGSPSSRTMPTRTIHTRLQSRWRRRASDNLYLGIPKWQYREIVLWTADEWQAARTGNVLSRPPPDLVDQLLRKWGIAPNFWCQAIEKFDRWFHRAVGHADRLAERARKRPLHGIRPSRKLFT